MMRIALFGGRFDPVHIGHLIVAQDVVEILSLDRLIFLPSYNPPHKPTQAPFDDRYRMIQLAIKGHPWMEVWDAERRFNLRRSYTVEVLRRLLPELPDTDEIFFLIGSDEFRHIHSWYRYQDLLKMVHVVVMKRPFYEVEVEEIVGKAERVHVVSRREIEVSSSEIRKRIRENREFRYLVPDPVYRYLQSHNPYTVFTPSEAP